MSLDDISFKFPPIKTRREKWENLGETDGGGGRIQNSEPVDTGGLEPGRRAGSPHDT